MTAEHLGVDIALAAVTGHEGALAGALQMGPRPRIDVRFEGLVGPDDATPDAVRATRPAPSHGSRMCFRLGAAVRGWRDVSPSRLLRCVEPSCRLRRVSDRQRRLAGLVDARAAELALPDACLVVARQEPCFAPPFDLLTSLAVLTKCLDTVWLRRREPSFSTLTQDASVVLLVPPSFASRWSLVTEPPPPERCSIDDLLSQPGICIDYAPGYLDRQSGQRAVWPTAPGRSTGTPWYCGEEDSRDA